MEFQAKIQFLGVEEQRVSDGKLFKVKCFADNEVIEFYVSGNHEDIDFFLDAAFADNFNCLFAIVPHPKFGSAFKLKFREIVV